jgi:protein-S-isoprenylcysteine O-methyltransferase Ste14
MDLRATAFKYRGLTPIPFILILIYQSKMSCWGTVIGLILAVAGEAIRIGGVRIAGGRTRTRNVGAKKLSVAGIYSHVRNPLYLGNIMIYLGFAIFAGGPWLSWLIAFSLIFFIIQYGLIIALEEETLAKIFKEEYPEYVKNVPRLIPRFTAWQSDNTTARVPWKRVLLAEKSTLINQIVILLIVILKEVLINR